MQMSATRAAVAAVGALIFAQAGTSFGQEAAKEPVGVSEGGTNGLIFKKRPRRVYTSSVTLNAPDATPDAPMPDEERKDHDDSGNLSRGSEALSSKSKPFSGMQAPDNQGSRPSRMARERAKKNEEDWLLTPQQRLQKEIDVLSGKEEEEEKKDGGWLVDDVQNIRDKKTREQEARVRQEEEDAEAEEIATIMGRDLFGVGHEGPQDPARLRDDRGRLKMPGGTAASATTNASSSQASTIRDRQDGAGGMGSRATTARDLGQTRGGATEAGGSGAGERDRTNPKNASAQSGMRQDSAGSTASKAGGEDRSPGSSADGGRDTTRQSGIPSPFAWNSSSGGGYAGLPASVAPSIMPSARDGAPASAFTSPGAAPSLPSLGGVSRMTPGNSGANRFSPYSSSTPGPGPAAQTPMPSRASTAPPMRTPFMSPMAPGLQNGGGFGTLPAVRP